MAQEVTVTVFGVNYVGEIGIGASGPAGAAGAAGAAGPAGAQGPKGIDGAASISLVVVNGPLLTDADATVEISQGVLRVLPSSVTLTGDRIIYLDPYGATNGDPIRFRIDAPQPFRLLFVNLGPNGNNLGPDTNYYTAVGFRGTHEFRFRQGPDLTNPNDGDWAFPDDGREYLGVGA